MKLFENGVGRPSNEIKKKRRTFVAAAVAVGVLVIGGVYLSFAGNTKKLRGDSSGKVTFEYSNKNACLSGYGIHGSKVKCEDNKNESVGISSDPTVKSSSYTGFTNPGYKLSGYTVKDWTNGKYLCVVSDGSLAWGKSCSYKKYVAKAGEKFYARNNRLTKSHTYVFYAQWSPISDYDADGDGKVTYFDAQYALKATAKLVPSTNDKYTSASFARKILLVANGVAKGDSNGEVTGDTGDTGVSRGDVNKDGKFTLEDAKKILRVSAKLETAPKSGREANIYDVNMDGTINAKDARMVLKLANYENSNTEPIIRGDVDGDGKVTEKDAQEVLQNSAKLRNNISSDPVKFAVADVNNDGSLTAADARIILRLACGM